MGGALKVFETLLDTGIQTWSAHEAGKSTEAAAREASAAQERMDAATREYQALMYGDVKNLYQPYQEVGLHGLNQYGQMVGQRPPLRQAPYVGRAPVYNYPNIAKRPWEVGATMASGQYNPAGINPGSRPQGMKPQTRQYAMGMQNSQPQPPRPLPPRMPDARAPQAPIAPLTPRESMTQDADFYKNLPGIIDSARNQGLAPKAEVPQGFYKDLPGTIDAAEQGFYKNLPGIIDAAKGQGLDQQSGLAADGNGFSVNPILSNNQPENWEEQYRDVIKDFALAPTDLTKHENMIGNNLWMGNQGKLSPQEMNEKIAEIILVERGTIPGRGGSEYNQIEHEAARQDLNEPNWDYSL